MGIADFLGAGTGGWYDAASNWIGNPENQAKLFKAGQAFDTMARAGYTDAHGRPLAPGPGSVLAEEGMKPVQRQFQRQTAQAIVDGNTDTAEEKKQAPGAISKYLGSDITHLENPLIDNIHFSLDENGNMKAVKIGSTSQKDLMQAQAIRGQTEAGVPKYDASKASSYLGSGQSPF